MNIFGALKIKKPVKTNTYDGRLLILIDHNAVEIVHTVLQFCSDSYCRQHIINNSPTVLRSKENTLSKFVYCVGHKSMVFISYITFCLNLAFNPCLLFCLLSTSVKMASIEIGYPQKTGEFSEVSDTFLFTS